MASPHHQLAWAFKRLAQAQSNRLDNLRFNATFNALPEEGAPQQILAQLCQGMGMAASSSTASVLATEVASV
jgi:hypothetical protein